MVDWRRVANKYREFKRLTDEIRGCKEMAEAAEDVEEREMAEAEMADLRSQREMLWEELLSLTVGGEDSHRTRCVMEIRAGTGGDEAALFARDLFEMYRRYAEQRGWKTEIMDASPTEMGGFKEITLTLGRRKRLSRLAVRIGRSPRPASSRNRNARPRSHLGCDGRGDARTGGCRSQLETGRLPRRQIRCLGTGWPTRQQDRIGDSVDASRNRNRGPVPG